ncbi:MAG: hypothetical protein AAGD25_33415 [Cyanobacteria bacterium P01_F01_bin.150]
MKKLLILFSLALLTVFSVKLFSIVNASTVTQSITEPSFYLGGIQVNEPDVKEWIKGLKKADMNTVAVTVYAKQGDWDSDNLWFDETNEGVIQEIREAKAQNMHVTLILRVALDHAFERNEFLWHGLIMPKTAADLDSWFAKYTDFVETWATIAQQENVDVLGIGSEMNSLTSTEPLQDLPGLVEYYMDEEKQQELKQEFLSNRDRVSVDDLWVSSGRQFETLDAFLDARLNAWQGWARQVSGIESDGVVGNGVESDGVVGSEIAGSTEENLEYRVALMNQRRHLLENHWRKLIRQTRSLYQGQLTYAANFDQYHEVTFWDALDFMGVNAYFSLRSDLPSANPASGAASTPESRDNEQLLSQLKDGWQIVLSDLEAFRQDNYITDKPVIFTELGYTYRTNSTIAPWAYDKVTLIDLDDNQDLLLANEQNVDFEERTLAMKALHQVSSTDYPDLLDGILYWKLSTQPNHFDIEPFVLILNDSPQDPLQDALKQFRE